jgi:outer membrane protein assembly factor BamB
MASSKTVLACALIAGTALLAACSGPSRPKPADIAPVPVLQEVRTAWSARIGQVNFPLVVAVHGDQHVALADGRGTVVVLNVRTGQDVWRVTLDQPISAGVGSNGQQVAVVTRSNQLVVLREGQVQWRQNLLAESFTPPLVAGGRVFVLGADRVVTAFDAGNGRKLWSQQRSGDPLVLRQAGVLLPYQNTLVVGFSGRMAGLNPDNGALRWETAIATPRGTNDMERLVDLLGPANRVGDTLCVRAFQSQVGCVQAERGQTLWSRPSVGERSVSGNETLVFSVLSNGVVQAHNRSNGERVWETERLRYRQLSAPLSTPRGVLVADSGGWLYVLSLADGNLLNRVRFEGDELVAAPAQIGAHTVLVSRDGRVTGLMIP